MEDENHTGLILSIIIGFTVLVVCGVVASLLIFLAWLII